MKKISLINRGERHEQPHCKIGNRKIKIDNTVRISMVSIPQLQFQAVVYKAGSVKCYGEVRPKKGLVIFSCNKAIKSTLFFTLQSLLANKIVFWWLLSTS